PVFLDKACVRKLPLRILVEILHVGMRGCRVEIKVILFDVFAVIALVAGQTKKAFLEERIATVPKSHCKTNLLVPVADPRYAIRAPAVGARASVVMREIIPGVAVCTIILANRSPLPLAEVGAPALPVDFARF